MKSAVTISLVPEAWGGPFVFWEDLDGGLRGACRKAADCGFDAVEVFPRSGEEFVAAKASAVVADHGLKLAAVGTGAGWVKHRVYLSCPDSTVRQRARQFVSEIIDAAGDAGAPAIVGSMQGPGDSREIEREADIARLSGELQTLGERARRHGVPLLYEPLNRYETKLCNTLDAGKELLATLAGGNVRLLADLFHMNIEEADVAGAIRRNGALVGHVHLADSNRRPAGNGHTDFSAVARALRDAGYDGYVSAECLPFPDGDGAARATIDAFNQFFR